MILFARIASPLGAVYATATAEGLTGLYFEGGRHAPPIAPDWREQPSLPLLHACTQQLAAYLAGRRREFDLQLAPRGTPFQMRVWRAIAAIPFGQTVSYAELARRAGAAGSARAAGAATGRNPLSIIVPCHRVVGSAGSLTGYAGGLERKERLLRLEGALALSLA